MTATDDAVTDRAARQRTTSTGSSPRRPARRLVAAGPRGHSAARPPQVVAALRAARRRGRAAGRRDRPAARPPATRPAAGRRPARLDRRQRRLAVRGMLDPVIDQAGGAPQVPPGRRCRPGRRQGHRRRGGRAAGLPVAQGARASTTSPPDGHAPAAAGRAQHRAGRARARRRPRATSGSGCACTRRPTGCSSPPCRGCATT